MSPLHEHPGEILRGDTAASVAFLQALQPSGPWTLSTDHGSFTTLSFDANNIAGMIKWIDQLQGRANIYFSVNRPRGMISKKADKFEIGQMLALHVDIDPTGGADTIDDERARILADLRAYQPHPTVIIFSGGGYWAFWVIEPVEISPPSLGAVRAKAALKTGVTPSPEDRAEYDAYLSQVVALEAFNKALECELNADNCHNIDRVARLPGTINVPNKKKLEKGRKPALAEVVEADWSRIYRLGDFQPVDNSPVPPPPPLASPRPIDREAPQPVGSSLSSLEKLPADVADWCRAVIVHGHDPANPDRYGGDRSRALWAVLRELARKKCPATIMQSIILDPAYGISAHIRDQKNPTASARRQIERAIAHVAMGAADFKRTDKNLIVANNQHNIRTAIAMLGVTLSRDEFADRLLIEGPDGAEARLFNDAELERVYLAIDEKFEFRAGIEYFMMVAKEQARRGAFHPVRRYLDSVQWDGVPRLGHWLTVYGGAENSAYTQAVGRIVLIAAVRRIRQPGVKFDEMVVLESAQGKNKSSALRILAVNDDWFSDDLPLNSDEKKVIETLAGHWIVEAAELNGMRKGETEHLKSFLSRQVDRARMSYERLVTEVPRQCVIVGTTNSNQYLRDSTGNRRFWPVKIEQFDIVALRRDRDQLWAEAAHAEAAGESIRLDPALYEAAAEEQGERLVADPWTDVIALNLGERVGKVPAESIWVLLNIPDARREQYQNMRMGDAMRENGWERKKSRINGKVQWCYMRGTPQERLVPFFIWRDNENILYFSDDKAPEPEHDNGPPF